MLKRRILFFLFFGVLIFVTQSFISTGFAISANLIKNPGFENVNNRQPTHWNTLNHSQGVELEITGDAHSGSKALSITNTQMNDTLVTQELKVKKGKVYRITYWLKAAVKNQPGSANITLYYVSNNVGCKGIYTSKEIRNTNGMWQQEEFYVKTRKDINDPLTFALRLGGQGTQNEGQVIFDDLTMSLVDNPTSGVEIYDFNAHKPDIIPPPVNDSNKTWTLSPGAIWTLLGIIFLTLFAVFEHKSRTLEKEKSLSSSSEDAGLE